MKYTVSIIFHGRENQITVDYSPMADKYEAGFHILNLPFDAEACAGYPMLHARVECPGLKGYERYCGWVQIIRREDYASIDDSVPAEISYELDVPEDFRERRMPYFALGYPAELFDAPCRNLRSSEKLVWRAYTYLVDIPSRINGYKMSCLAGFSWGYTENVRGEVSVLDFQTLSEDDWKAHRKYAEFDY